MNIDLLSFILGVIVGAGMVGLALIAFTIIKPWRYAFFCGAPLSLFTILGMRLRGNPPMLLINAYVILVQKCVTTSIREVESVYIQNRTRIISFADLVRLVEEELKKA